MIAHLDATTGISGDKFLGALLDAASALGEEGVSFSEETLADAVRSLAPEACIALGRARRGGVEGVTVSVSAGGDTPHRTWNEIRGLLAEARVPGRTRERALLVFERIAAAEARVHGCDIESVHFHEVGAIDSIADVIGVCLALEALEVTHLTVTPVAVGSGVVQSAHGALPVPAPATALILQGVPVEPGHASGELTTPTGAALVAVLADAFGPLPPMVPVCAGHGAGTRELDGAPNIARIVLGEPGVLAGEDAVAAGTGHEPVTLLETTLDHLSPEAVAFAAEELAAEGALDVWTAPVAMKKRRLGVVLSVLASPLDAERLTRRIHELTGTLGVRRSDLSRSVAARSQYTIATAWGPVRVKAGSGRLRPEADDVARIARESGRAFDEVERELADAARRDRGHDT